VEYRPETDSYRATYSNGTIPPSLAVVWTIEEITDRDTHELEPLSNVIDPHALDALFDRRANGIHRGDGEVRFTYQLFDVFVRSYGVIEIRPTQSSE
jgi:hypothetical protein